MSKCLCHLFSVDHSDLLPVVLTVAVPHERWVSETGMMAHLHSSLKKLRCVDISSKGKQFWETLSWHSV